MRSFKSYLVLSIFAIFGNVIGIAYSEVILVITNFVCVLFFFFIYFDVKSEIKEYEIYQYKLDRLVQYLISKNHEIPSDLTHYKSKFLDENYMVMIKYFDEKNEECYGQITVNLPPYFNTNDKYACKGILLSNNDIYELPKGFEVVDIKKNKSDI